MKTMKKLSSLLLAFIMLLATAVPALAANDNSLTVENTGKTDHVFELYQIFKGEVSGTEGSLKLSNIQWGNGVNGPEGVASDKAETLKTETDAENFAKEISDKLQNPTSSGKVKAGVTYKFDNLEAGYYLVKDTEKSQTGDNSSYTLYLLKVVGPVTAKTKLDVPTVEKHVKDINDSEDENYKDWSKTADHDIGDKVPFKLTGTLPSNFDKYETYKYVFHDEMSTGLTFDKDSVKVYVDGTEIKTGFTIATTTNGFTVTFEDLKNINSVKSTSKITVEYEATLNEQAVLGSTGNPNEVYLEYSNNPNKGGDGDTGKTPKDKVIVFTYKVLVNKVDGKEKPLTGAAFKLEKFDKVKNKYVLVKEIEAGETTKFEFKGLDDGQYKLSETKTPKGYNTIKPIEFKITASHDDKNLKLTDLNGNALEGEVELKMTANTTEGSLTTNVVNKQGPELPETGGTGTTLLYVFGTLFVIGGVIYLVRQRKTSINK
ncbi:isopeptide-forming domain-containing fimbrial protein [Peptoniphilus asaccharolyticus]